MKITVKGKGDVSLDKNDFIAAGGQGSVYAKGGKAYKIYADPTNMIPVGKIQELSGITLPNIVKPEDLIIDAKGTVIGYTMTFVKDTYAFCQGFTKDFKTRNHITPQISFGLVKKLQEIVQHVHEKDVLIVDLNEMNFLIDHNFKSVYAIDVDSYQTKSFPATVIMDSIRDRHVHHNKFTTGSDWFSFAILACQLMIGIHPYKGKHHTIKTLDERMHKNVSIFNPNVSIPPVCYDFSVIPANYLSFLKAVLEEGKRVDPPKDGQIFQIVQVQRVTNLSGTNSFIINKVYEYGEEIITFNVYDGIPVCNTVKGLYVNKNFVNKKRKGEVFITPKYHTALVVEKASILKIHEAISDKELKFEAANTGIMQFENRLYYKDDSNVYEVKIIEHNTTTTFISSKKIGNVLPNVNFYDGCIIQNMIGAYYISLFPQSETCYQVKLPIIDGYRIIDAKYDNKVLMVIGEKKGKYDKIILRFNDTFDEYDTRVVNDITFNGFNFVVMDNGICAHIPEDDVLELFSNKKDSKGMKVINDPFIKTDMKLAKYGVQTMFIKDNEVYTLKMKP